MSHVKSIVKWAFHIVCVTASFCSYQCLIESYVISITAFCRATDSCPELSNCSVELQPHQSSDSLLSRKPSCCLLLSYLTTQSNFYSKLCARPGGQLNLLSADTNIRVETALIVELCLLFLWTNSDASGTYLSTPIWEENMSSITSLTLISQFSDVCQKY